MDTVARFTTPEEAHLARCLLEGNGIQAWVFDEFYVQMFWLHSLAIGGVRLVVADADLAGAQDTLQASRWDGGDYEIPRGGVLIAIMSMLIGVPFMLFGRRIVRGRCGAGGGAIVG